MRCSNDNHYSSWGLFVTASGVTTATQGPMWWEPCEGSCPRARVQHWGLSLALALLREYTHTLSWEFSGWGRGSRGTGRQGGEGQKDRGRGSCVCPHCPCSRLFHGLFSLDGFTVSAVRVSLKGNQARSSRHFLHCALIP